MCVYVCACVCVCVCVCGGGGASLPSIGFQNKKLFSRVQIYVSRLVAHARAHLTLAWSQRPSNKRQAESNRDPMGGVCVQQRSNKKEVVSKGGHQGEKTVAL